MTNIIGIIGAMQEEVIVIKNDMTDIIEENIFETIFIKGKLYGKDIVLVESGIGKVNAAITATILINHYNVDEIIFSGVAGATNEKLSIGDVVISTDLIQHDFDVTEFGYEKGQIARMKEWKFKASEKLLNKTKNIVLDKNKVYYGRIISGDQFISSKELKKNLGEEFEALCVDMESASVAHVCYRMNKEFLIVRSISDSVTDDSTMEFSEFVNIAAINSKEIIRSLI